MRILVAAFLAVLSTASATKYEKYHGINVGPLKTKEHAQLIENLRDEHDLTRRILVLQDHYIADGYVDLVVDPERVMAVTRALEMAGLEYKTITTDLQKTLNKNNAQNAQARDKYEVAKRKARARGALTPVPEYYMRYDEMVQWLQDSVVEAQAAGIDARIVEIGNSYEGRIMYLVEINADSALPKSFIDAGIHAREWISPATMVWILHEILFGTSADAIDMRTNYAWYISTSINPDGYEFSHTDDRFWRKNRQLNAGSICVGTDLNRNWDANWSACGTSTVPCSDVFHGEGPASCIETQNVMAALTDRASDLGLYITVHSYSQLWLIPWAGSETKPSDYSDLFAVGQQVVAAIESVNGKVFVPGTVPDLLSCGAGGSFDWVKNGNPSFDLTGTGLGIKHCYAPELRPASAAEGGFDIPPTEIPLSGAEIYAGVVTAVRNVHG